MYGRPESDGLDAVIRVAAILVGTLSYRSFFTPRHQLRTTLSGH
jgi:hypothetical protein